MILLLVAPLLAADSSQYSLVAPLHTPASGVAVVPLPADLIGAWPDLDRSMMVQGADGEQVPYTVVLSPNPEARERESTYVRPLGDNTYQVSAFERPVDMLVLDVRDNFAWRVSVAVGDGPYQEAGFAWHLDHGGEQLLVPVPVSVGPFRVRISPLDEDSSSLSDVTGWHVLPNSVVPNRETLPAVEPVLNENGSATYHFQLPGPRMVRRVRLLAKDTIFSRQVSVNNVDSFRAERVEVGGAHLDHVLSGYLSLRTDAIDLEIETDRGMPLELEGIEVTSDSGVMVLRNGGEAQLFAGTLDEGTPFDLSVAAIELLRANAQLGRLEPLAPNPAYVPPPTREGVDGPGTVLESTPQRWSRAIVAEPGWVRVQLDTKLLAHAQGNLADLRVVDAENHEIPYLVRPQGKTAEPQELTFKREEVGSDTLIRVPLEAQGAPIERVMLQTEQGTFQRTVEIVRDRGVSVETLRSVEWIGSERGKRLALNLNQEVGSELMIRIRNGDNGPLTISHLWVTRPTSELLVRVPPSGASLIYGAKRVHEPNYDLALLKNVVLQMQVTEATLGPETERGGPALTWMDRMAAMAAMALLAVGLIGMTLRVLVAAKEPEEAEPPKTPNVPPPVSA